MTILFSSIILAVYGFGVWLWHKQRKLLLAERTDLETLQSNLVNRPAGVQIEPLLGLENIVGIVRKRVDALVEVRERNGRLDNDALSQVSESQLTHGNGLIRYIAGSLILMGLFGTLIGLIFAVSGLSQAISIVNVEMNDLTRLADSFREIAGQIKGTLSGMKTAFVASLLGVGTTIVLSFMLTWLTQAQERFLSELEETIARRLVPHYFPQEQTQNLGQFTRAMQETRKLLDLVANKIKTDASKADESFKHLLTLVTSFNRFTSTFQDTHGAAQQQLLKQLGELSTIINGIGSAMKSTVTTVDNMATISKASLADVQKVMSESQEKLEKNFKIFQATMEDILTGMMEGAFVRSLENFDKSSQALVQQLGHVKDQQEKATRELQQLGHYFGAEGRFSEVSSSIITSSGNLEKKAAESLASDLEQLALIKVVHETLEKDALNHSELVALTKELVDLHKENGKYLPLQVSMQAGEQVKSSMPEQVVYLLQDIAKQINRLNVTFAPAPSRSIFYRLFGGGAQQFSKAPLPQTAPEPDGDYTEKKSHEQKKKN